MPFLDDHFLLRSEAARRLYHDHAVGEPIFDYHCHLRPVEVARDRRFADLADIWLGGDHYKWRAMRANGVAEAYCTGDADPYDKFLAWVRTVPMTMRNPLYHWSHLELRRYFGIDLPIREENARAIWEQANARLAEPEFSARGILKRFRVTVVCTTDDPADSLEHHAAFRKEQIDGTTDCPTRLYPTFRPDRALRINETAEWNGFVDRLEAASGQDCATLEGFLAALRQRHDFFHSMGCRLSDHGMARMYDGYASEADATLTYDAARAGRAVGAEATERFGGFLMEVFGRLDAEKGWTKQLHIGALRSARSHLLHTVGPDVGADSIGDLDQARPLARYLDRLDSAGMLPKVVLYNLNPRDNYVFATMAGNFQDGITAGKIQFGSGWWFLDQKEGMEWQINALSQLGLLPRFVGMLTDSRSFLSYPRHEYFRRVLCNLIGADIENGELPADWEWLGGIVRDICFRNASEYFGLEHQVL